MYHVATPTPSQLAQKQHEKSQRYLSDARSRGKEEGMRRREEIRSWLRDRQTNPTIENPDDVDSTSLPVPPPTESSGQGDIAGFGNAVSVRKSKRMAAFERDR